MKKALIRQPKKTPELGDYEKHFVCVLIARNHKLAPGKITTANLRQSRTGWVWGSVEFEPVQDGDGRPLAIRAFDRFWLVYAELKFTASFIMVSDLDDSGLAKAGTANIPAIPEDARQAIFDFQRERGG